MEARIELTSELVSAGPALHPPSGSEVHTAHHLTLLQEEPYPFSHVISL